jgi:NAD(P)-dependent dehydrogenase (short-subunit alcohol dehydrogenase family)
MYSASKAACESLVRTWAEAFGGKQKEFAFMAGTTANAVQVGLTKTSALSRASSETVARYTDVYVPQQSIPRLAEPEDVADVVCFLCSRQARWITGSVLSASGGGCNIG